MIKALVKIVLALSWVAAVLVVNAAMYNRDNMSYSLSLAGLAEDSYRTIAIMAIVASINILAWHIFDGARDWWRDRNYLADCDYQLQKHQVSIDAWMSQLEIWKQEDNESRIQIR